MSAFAKNIKLVLPLVLVLSIVGCGHTTNVATPTTNATTSLTKATATATQTTTSKMTKVAGPATYIAASSLGLVDRNLYTYGDVDKKLADSLESVLKKYKNNISIACWSTDGSRAVLYNTKQTYFSACTIKMPVMYAYCKQIDAGKIDADKKLTYASRHYYGGSGEIRHQPYGTQYSTKYLIEKSLSVSDNVAYVMLLEEYGKDAMNATVEQLGCDSVAFSSGSKWAKQMNARDLMVVWSEVYKYFCSGSSNAKMLKDACTNTDFNYGTEKITEYDYSHKSGDNFGEFRAYHDAGIVWSDVPYVYVVLTRSEGTAYDRATVDASMEIVKEIMTNNEGGIK